MQNSLLSLAAAGVVAQISPHSWRTSPLLLALLLLSAPAAVQAQSGSGDGYNYTINPDGISITITGYTGPGGAVTIPTSINGLAVTSIGGGRSRVSRA